MPKTKISAPKKRTSGKGNPPKLDQVNPNISKQKNNSWVTLNFRVSPEFRREFKQCALDKDLSMNELLKVLFKKRD